MSSARSDKVLEASFQACIALLEQKRREAVAEIAEIDRTLTVIRRKLDDHQKTMWGNAMSDQAATLADAILGAATLKTLRVVLGDALAPGGNENDLVRVVLTKREIATLSVLVDDALGSTDTTARDAIERQAAGDPDAGLPTAEDVRGILRNDEQTLSCNCSAKRAGVGDICPRCGGTVVEHAP